MYVVNETDAGKMIQSKGPLGDKLKLGGQQIKHKIRSFKN